MPKEAIMARCNCSWCDSRAHKDFRHDKGDGWEDTPRRKASGKKKARSKRAGCPGNEGKAHVYVWTSEGEYTGMVRNPYTGKVYESFYKKNGYFQYERKTCVGCGKVAKTRNTEQFQKLIAKVGWYRAMYGDRSGW